MFRALLSLFAVVAFAGTASAHHSQAGLFDSPKTIEITGVVKSMSWRNPHGHITLAVDGRQRQRRRLGRGNRVDQHSAQPRRRRGRHHQRRRQDHDRGRRAAARRSGDSCDAACCCRRAYEFTFGSAKAYFPEGKAGKIVGNAAIDGECRAGPCEGGRLVPRLVHDHERPGRVPDIQGRLSADGRGQGRAAKWNPRDNVLLKCGHKGTPLIMITPLPMEFVHQGDNIFMRIEEYDARRMIHMNPKRRGAGGAHVVRLLARALGRHDARRRDRPHRGRLLRSRRRVTERPDQDRRAVHAERGHTAVSTTH